MRRIGISIPLTICVMIVLAYFVGMTYINMGGLG